MPATIKRNKPRLAVTVDKDVMAWLQNEAARRRGRVSHVVNELLAEYMECNKADCPVRKRVKRMT